LRRIVIGKIPPAVVVTPLVASVFGLVTPAPAEAAIAPVAAVVTERPVDVLYREAGLAGIIENAVFVAGYRQMERRNLHARMLAIADMTQPSTAQRLVIIDLEQKKVVLRTWVAHGQNSGDLMAERFSNRDGSHQTSLGLYRVGMEIVSPKHGPALLLHGLDQGLNDKARMREVIIHGADYVSARFIATNGRLGRSWGCPAVPRRDMARVIELLADDGLLYVAGR
jgi:hypothetical protein